MPAVSKDEALALLTREIEANFDADEVREVYHELFPNARPADQEVTSLIERLVHHVNSGRAVEEIVELWGLIFPRHRNIWYNEEAEAVMP